MKPLRMTPAMAAGVVDQLWSLEDLCEALLAEPEGEKPGATPLAYRMPEVTARELPGGRGWLRVAGGSGKGAAPKASPPPAPEPEPEPAAAAPVAHGGPPAAATPIAPAAASDDRQLDLFAWKPCPRKLDENKTDDPRAWALSPGVVRALRAWRALRAAEGAPVGPDDPVFVLREDGRKYDAAKLFREHLCAAGIDRAELFEHSAARMQIRRHDLRATFVTLNLAAGRTEAWIADRTGHKSSAMINRYRRAARTAAELALGELRPLIEAIPELAGAEPSTPPGGKGGEKAVSEPPDSKTPVPVHGFEP